MKRLIAFGTHYNMSLSTQDIEVLKRAKAEGKTKEQALALLAQSRKPQTFTEEQQPSPFSGVASDFRARVNKASNAQIDSAVGKQSLMSGALQTIGQGAGFVGDIVGRGVSAITPDFIKEPLKAGVEKLAGAETVQDTATSYAKWKEANPEAAANLESVINIGSLIPVGQGVTATAKTAGKATAIATGEALTRTAGATALSGRAIKGAGSTLYKSAITPNVQEAERILAYRAKTPFLSRVVDASKEPLTRGKTALEQGLYGTESMVGVQAKRKSDSLWNKEIAPAVKNSDVQMTKDELFSSALERINATTDPTRRKALINAYDALLEDYAEFPEAFDLTKAQALKRDLAQFTPAKVFKGQDVASEVRMLQADMADAVRRKTYDSLSDINIKKKYLDWANLHELENIGVKAISEAQFKGGSGTLIGGLWDMATTPIKTVGGQVIYRVGDFFEFKAPKGVKTFGEYLKKQGYEKPVNYAEIGGVLTPMEDAQD